jgi:serine/threonine protein kinase
MTPHAGPFELLEVAGRGGMGVVWRARHPAVARPVAVKLLDAADGKVLRIVTTPALPTLLRLSPDGRTAFATTGGALVSWDLAGLAIGTRPLTRSSATAVSRDANWVATNDSAGRLVLRRVRRKTRRTPPR